MVGRKLREGLSNEAEKLLIDTIEGYSHSPDNLATLKRLLSFTLETVGRYKESLEVVKPFEDEDILQAPNKETQIRITTQLAIAYNNLTDQPKAVTLLKETLQQAQENELTHLSGIIDIALARVYRKLNEFPICPRLCRKIFELFSRKRQLARDGRSLPRDRDQLSSGRQQRKSLEYFDLGIQIIGERSAPFMLGKLYTDMSGAYGSFAGRRKASLVLKNPSSFSTAPNISKFGDRL